MILQKIELNNFGSYKDYNVFNLDTSDPSKKIIIRQIVKKISGD